MNPQLEPVLRRLATAGIGLHVNAAGKLVVRAAPGTLDDDLRQLITTHKPALLQQLGSEQGRLVKLTEGGSAAPLFLVHAGRGDIDYARRLAQVLDPAVPVYALVPPGLNEGEACCDSVEALGALYRQAIRSVQPHGPYRIGGWSAGGTLAFELARAFEADGEAPGFVALFDTSAAYDTPVVPEDAAAAQAAALLAWLPASLPDEVACVLRARQENGDLEGMLATCGQAGVLPPGVDVPMLRRHLAVWHGIRTALRRYVPRPAGFPTHLFVAADAPRTDLVLGWQRHGIPVTKVAVGGDHYSMLTEPHLARLGSELSRRLAAESTLINNCFT